MLRKIYHYYDDKIFPYVQDIRGFTRIKSFLRKLSFLELSLEKTKKRDELDAFSKDWDNLIIIDSCRQDYFEEVTGYSGSRISKASATPEYVRKNFSEGDFSEFVYISANPHLSDLKFKQLTGRGLDEVFHAVFKTFNSNWDEEKNTVLPKNTVKDALTANKLFPDKKLIIHFLPPHYPFVKSKIQHSGIRMHQDNLDNETIWEKAEKGKIGHEQVKNAYCANIEYVANFVEELTKKIEGKSILTSDHGNLVGENGFYGHPEGREERPLKTVPWVEF